ncbi:T9SS type A sorting domain-containing protein [Polaribacter haliotis]|uniref:T9SS type A sorting domain-containing protein n=1 Tax=Polaribacter haliotis TaxID=1888915 RepID=A0A7L8AEZ7_9FLAO|nr:T9SS type A sorting domain-containing protein [Polaribacter haliotis]QOD60593.1 T9SS type A sorting domain-containing protein [Polaribacter haliotis]
MFYNTLNYNSNPESENRTIHLKTILDDVQPDLFMVCELKNETASDYLFANAVATHNSNFKSATFRTGTSPDKSLLQMVYYNNAKLELESNSIIPTILRDINHYTFKIRTSTITTNPIRIEVFVTHLKASRGIENRQKRLSAVNSLVRELDRLPKDSNILFAGDFNFYTSNEEGFQKILDPNNPIKLVDPINVMCPAFPEDGKDYYEDDYDSTYFWNNSTFANVHSQSTRTGSLSDGAGGGMDDRFDFIIMSENLKSSNTLFYKQNTYETIGNNGNCYNSFVSSTTCTGKFSQEVRNALYFFSDHLPIVMELETPMNILSIEKENPIAFVKSNIVSDFLSLNVNKIASLKKIIIYNQLGQIIVERNIRNQHKITINTSSFSKGIYYLKTGTYKPLKFVKI